MNRLAAIALAMLMTGMSFAQENNNPDELKKNLADALNQLKAAQDRRNELANENEGLKNRLAELEKQLSERANEVQELKDKTWFWRSHYAAWQRFIERYPILLTQWQIFIEHSPLGYPSAAPQWTETTDAVPNPPSTPAAP